jgi:membrane-associated protease RseP (regulator of RpoE activity)
MILLGIYEMAAGRLVKPRMYARLQMIGALFIILLFIIASIGDIRFFL